MNPPTAPRRRILIIYNPTAGRFRRRHFAATLDALAAAGAEAVVRETRGRGDAERFSAAARDCDVIVAAGGDGTINEVVNGLRTDAPPLALIPLGTANVLAAEIGLGTQPREVAAAIVAGPVRRVYAARANERRFLMMAGAGLDARVVRGVNGRLKRWLGKGAYGIETIVQLLRDAGRPFAVKVDGREYSAAAAVAANGHYYGGRFVLAPAARLDSPELQVCLFKRAGRWNLLRYTAAVVSGRIHRLPDYEIVRGKTIVVEGPVTEPVQGDGEIIGHLPVRIAPEPEPISLVMPADD